MSASLDNHTAIKLSKNRRASFLKPRAGTAACHSTEITDQVRRNPAPLGVLLAFAMLNIFPLAMSSPNALRFFAHEHFVDLITTTIANTNILGAQAKVQSTGRIKRAEISSPQIFSSARL